MIVAIDGPAGAGKSTVARAVAERLGFVHLDTGAMYRAVTVGVVEDALDSSDARALQAFVQELQISLTDGRVSLRDRDLTARIRDPDVTTAVPQVAAAPEVRRALVPLQQELAGSTNVVVEGRDIGTVVFPDADVKVFLTASPEARAARRARQYGVEPARIEVLEKDIAARDAADSTRATSPLVAAPGSHHIDSTELTFEEVVDAVVRLVRGVTEDAAHG